MGSLKTSGSNFSIDILDCDIAAVGQQRAAFNYLTSVHIYVGKVHMKILYAIPLTTSMCSRRYRTGFHSPLRTLPLRRRAIVKQLIPLHFSRRRDATRLRGKKITGERERPLLTPRLLPRGALLCRNHTGHFNKPLSSHHCRTFQEFARSSAERDSDLSRDLSRERRSRGEK